MAKKSSIKILSQSQLRKKYNSNTAIVMVEEDPLFLPSTILSLNYQLGGGIPYGKMLELYGEESTGKSLLATTFAASCQSLGGQVLWIDAESAWTNYWARLNGVEPKDVELLVDNRMEVISDWTRDMAYYYRSILTKNEPILIVLDSLAMVDKMDNADKTMSDAKAEMGGRAKAIGDFWRIRMPTFYKLGVCVIAINQTRKKLGASMFEDTTTTPGGESTKFAASQRIQLVRSKQIKNKKGRKIGQNVYTRVIKNKIAPPVDSVLTQVYFKPNQWDYVGYNKYGGMKEIWDEEGLIQVKGATIKFKDKTIARGEDSLINNLHNDPKLRKALIKRSSINTISKTRERLESMETNLFEVNKAAEDEDE